MGGERWAVGGGRWAVGGERWAVGGGRWTVNAVKPWLSFVIIPNGSTGWSATWGSAAIESSFDVKAWPRKMRRIRNQPEHYSD